MTREIVRPIALPRWGTLCLVAAGSVLIAPHGGADAMDVQPGGVRSSAVVVLAGGCYWGVESVFEHVRGVTSAISGFAIPASGATGADPAHAEAVRLVYDPSQLSYRQILDVFFLVVHDPTQLNRQGPDVGAEYRSIVFVDTDAQRRVVRAYIDSLSAAHAYPRPIVTEIDALQSFQPVDASQQDYAERHPTDAYIMTYDAPKVKALRQRFAALYRE